MNTQLPSADAVERPPRIRQNKRVRVVLLLLSMTALFIVAWRWQRSQTIAGQVEQIGGTIRVDNMESLPARIANWLAGRPSIRAHWIELDGSDVDGAWLRNHREQLAALDSLHLRMGWTDVTDEGLKHLRGLQNIVAINISGTKVTDAGLEHLSTLPNAGMLFVAHTDVTRAGIEAISTMPLMHLSIEETRVNGSDLAVLTRFPGLQSLGIDGKQLTESDMSTLRECRSLTDLGVSHASDESITMLEGWTALQQLDVMGPDVTDASIPALSSLDGLVFLDLFGTSISDDGLQTLREALPGCQVVRPVVSTN